MTDLIQNAKDEATQLKVQSESDGTPITRALALELTAKRHGFPDWNRYRAHLVKQQMHTVRPLRSVTTLIGPPGSGKSWLLRLYAAQQYLLGKRLLWLMPYPAERDPDFAIAFQACSVVTLETEPSLSIEDTGERWLNRVLAQIHQTPEPKGLVLQLQRVAGGHPFLKADLWAQIATDVLWRVKDVAGWWPERVLMDEINFPHVLMSNGVVSRLTQFDPGGQVVLSTQYSGARDWWRASPGDRCTSFAFQLRAERIGTGTSSKLQFQFQPAGVEPAQGSAAALAEAVLAWSQLAGGGLV